jgi:hypothetical protein
MGATHFIAARVSSETKHGFRKLAERQYLTESALLKRLVDSAVRSAGDVDGLKLTGRRLRGSRICVRLHPDDERLVSERAALRQMAVATYISVLVRAHLRNLSPLPKTELMALKQSVAELGAIGRNLNQLTRHTHQGQAGPTRADLLTLLRACEALRDFIKDLIKATSHSWKVGDEDLSP